MKVTERQLLIAIIVCTALGAAMIGAALVRLAHWGKNRGRMDLALHPEYLKRYWDERGGPGKR